MMWSLSGTISCLSFALAHAHISSFPYYLSTPSSSRPRYQSLAMNMSLYIDKRTVVAMKAALDVYNGHMAKIEVRV